MRAALKEHPEEAPRSIFSWLDPALFVISARAGDRQSARVLTWVMDATLTDAHRRVIVALWPEGFTAELIEASGRFVLHLLAEGQEELVPHLGLHSGRDEDKLRGLSLARTASGLPRLRDTCSWCECAVISLQHSLDRTIIFAEVEEEGTDLTGLARRPLTLSAACARLPAEIVEAIEERRRCDGAREHALYLEHAKLEYVKT